jgi:hypothetical protein
VDCVGRCLVCCRDSDAYWIEYEIKSNPGLIHMSVVPMPEGVVLSRELPEWVKLSIADAVIVFGRIEQEAIEIAWLIDTALSRIRPTPRRPFSTGLMRNARPPGGLELRPCPEATASTGPVRLAVPPESSLLGYSRGDREALAIQRHALCCSVPRSRAS